MKLPLGSLGSGVPARLLGMGGCASVAVFRTMRAFSETEFFLTLSSLSGSFFSVLKHMRQWAFVGTAWLSRASEGLVTPVVQQLGLLIKGLRMCSKLFFFFKWGWIFSFFISNSSG